LADAHSAAHAMYENLMAEARKFFKIWQNLFVCLFNVLGI
jgi:prolyl-tRNA synthetase